MIDDLTIAGFLLAVGLLAATLRWGRLGLTAIAAVLFRLLEAMTVTLRQVRHLGSNRILWITILAAGLVLVDWLMLFDEVGGRYLGHLADLLERGWF